MLVFIDDSGDPGFSAKSGVSSHLVIACVIFDDELEAEKTAIAIKELRRVLFHNDKTEFKFNKSSKVVRLTFLKCLLPYHFRVRAIVMTKDAVYSQELRTSKDSFYNFTTKQVLKNNQGTLVNAKIRLDGHGDRLFRKNFTSYLRRELNSENKRVAQDIKLVDSSTNVLIQMADMIVGSIRRSFDTNKTDSMMYRKIINKKIEDCWEFK